MDSNPCKSEMPLLTRGNNSHITLEKIEFDSLSLLAPSEYPTKKLITHKIFHDPTYTSTRPIKVQQHIIDKGSEFSHAISSSSWEGLRTGGSPHIDDRVILDENSSSTNGRQLLRWQVLQYVTHLY